MKDNIFTPELIAESEAIKRSITKTSTRLGNVVVGKDIPACIDGHNIFMGIGLITGSNRVSKGLGLGFINMACLAREIQKTAQDEKLTPHIFILVADRHAVSQTNCDLTIEQIMKIGPEIAQATRHLFLNLGCSLDTVHVVSAFDKGWPVSEDGYLNQEVSDIVYAHGTLDCGIKIGWQTKRQNLSGMPIRDEKWFDQQSVNRYPNLLADMAFIRAPEWLSLATHLDQAVEHSPTKVTKKISISHPYGEPTTICTQTTRNTGALNLPLPPYFGDDDRFALGKPVDIDKMKQTGLITKQMSKALGTIRTAVGITLSPCKRPTIGENMLQQLINNCCE